MAPADSYCYTALCGQDKAKRLFAKALCAERIPHAYLFRGPDGVGKKRFAHGVAMAINCRRRQNAKACGHCPSCRKYVSGNHPDLVLISPQKGTIRIEQIRSLTKELSYPPFEAAMRVVIIEDIHTMRREAANSLLKTLEEPPVDNLLILTADSSREILATLLSRCQVLPFTPLSKEQTVAVLLGHGLSGEVATLLAGFAQGSPGRALTLERSEMVEVYGEVVGLLDDPRLHPDRTVGQILRAAEKMAALKEDLPTFLGLLRMWLVECLRREIGGTSAEVAALPRKSWSSSELFATLQAISRAEGELARNCGRNLVCEVLLFRLQGMRTGTSVGV
jgi:DNA polymerase III subunit delta'